MSTGKTCSELAETYYDSEDGYKYYSVLYSEDYSGAGVYPSEHLETDIDDFLGPKYLRGDGLTIRQAVEARNENMLRLIKKSIPQGRKLKILELGAGRGGLTRHVAAYFQKEGLLEKMVASNIAQKENEFNEASARDQGFGADLYEVVKMSFDDISYPPDTFDLIYSNDAFLHSVDKKVMLEGVCRVLKPGGALVFSDILENPEAPKEVLEHIYARLELDCLGTKDLYTNVLKASGLSEVETILDTRNMERHYGMTKYSAQVLKHQELLGVVSEDFIAKQVSGLTKWISAAHNSHIQWGWFAFKKDE